MAVKTSKKETSNKETSKKNVKRKRSTKKKEVEKNIVYGGPEDPTNNPDVPVEDENSTTTLNTVELNYFGWFSPINDTIIIDIDEILGPDFKSSRCELANSSMPECFAELTIDDPEELIFNNRALLINGQYMSKDSVLEGGINFKINAQGCFSGYTKNLSPRKIYDGTDMIFHLKIVDFAWVEKLGKDNYKFNITITVHSENQDDTYKINLELYVSMFYMKTDLFQSCTQPLMDKDISYMLLRTNPKITGNIKLVVDHNQNIWLDTFKVSRNLAHNNYRKVGISDEGNYPKDVYQVFKSLPKGDIFKLPENVTDSHKSYINFEDQYETVYNYGAETNDDFLYSENFRILAPLWINETLPDFFAIFRVDSWYNEDTYMTNSISSFDKMKEFLSEGEVVQIFDLRPNTPIGKYLNNYKNKYLINNSLFLQFSQFNKEINEPANLIPLGKNSWYGISLDTGVITHKDETCYFGNKILKNQKDSQEKFDGYLVGGFERNNMVISNLLNLEFMFNDLNSDDFSMHRYFGLYLKKNQLEEYYAVEKELKNGITNIVKYDMDFNVVDDSHYDDIINKYPDKLFFGEAGTSIKRIKTANDNKLFFLKEAANKAGQNILSSDVQFVGTDDTMEFITLKMKRAMKAGEHLKIIIPTDSLYINQYIFEIIASNDERLVNTVDNISPYVYYNQKDDPMIDPSAYIYTKLKNITGHISEEIPDSSGVPSIVYKGESITGFEETSYEDVGEYPWKHVAQFDSIEPNLNAVANNWEVQQDPFDTLPNTVMRDAHVSEEYYNQLKFNFNTIVKYPKIFRLAFYSQDLENSETEATIYDQIKRIAACIKKFNYSLYIGDIKGSQFSIVSANSPTYFQHITNDILDIPWDGSLNFTSENGVIEDSQKEYIKEIYENKKEVDPTFEYFNEVKLDINTYPIHWDTGNYTQQTCAFAPIDFELLGWRKSAIVKFVQVPKYTYQISLPNETIDWMDTIVSVKNLRNRFIKLDNFQVAESYIANVQDSVETYNSTYQNDIIYNLLYLKSPLDLNKWIITVPEIAGTINSHINLYLPLKSDLSLMSILPLKDFDYRSTEEIINIGGLQKISVPKGNKIYINNYYSPYTIKTNVLYKLERGLFENIPIPEQSSFIIYEDWVEDKKSYIIKYNKDNTALAVLVDYIIPETDVVIVKKYAENESSIQSAIPPHNIINYYNNNDVQNILTYPIALPVNFKWESNGGYFDYNSILNTNDIINYSLNKNAYIISTGGIYNDDLHILNNLHDNIRITDKQGNRFIDTWENIIRQSLIDYPFTRFLRGESKEKSIQYNKTYYNQYTDSLNFILNGLKITIKLKNNIYNNDIVLSHYDNYNIILMIDYINDNEPSDFYISEYEKMIVIILHNFDVEILKKKVVKHRNENFFNKNTDQDLTILNSYYNWEKSPFVLDVDRAYGTERSDFNMPDSIYTWKSSTLNKLFIPYIGYRNLFGDASVFSEISYFDYNLNDIEIDQDFMKNFAWVMPYVKQSSERKSVEFNDTKGMVKIANEDIWNFTSNYFTRIWGNESNVYNYGPLNLSTNYSKLSTEAYLINYIKRYNINYDYDVPLLLKSYIQDTDFNIIIIKEDKSCHILNQTDDIQYFLIDIDYPKVSTLKYNYGYFNPRFIDIINFYKDEELDIINTTKKSFLYANTNIKNVNSMNDLYINKVFNENIQDNIFINYTKLGPTSIFASNWDKGFYKLYQSENDYRSINGYFPGIEDKTYFGSKCLVLNDPVIEITEWPNLSTSIENGVFTGTNKSLSNYPDIPGDTYKNQNTELVLTVKVNLSQAFYNYFMNSDNRLYQNWKNIDITEKDFAINNYIQKTLTKYFKLTDKNNLRVYSKVYKLGEAHKLIETSKPKDFSNYRREENISVVYENINNEIILTLTIRYNKNKTYYLTSNIKSV